MSWRKYSACLDESPELFFPIGKAGHALRYPRGKRSLGAGSGGRWRRTGSG